MYFTLEIMQTSLTTFTNDVYRTIHQFVHKYNYADYWCTWIVQYDKQWYLTLSLRKYSKITSQTFNFQTQKSFQY